MSWSRGCKPSCNSRTQSPNKQLGLSPGRKKRKPSQLLRAFPQIAARGLSHTYSFFSMGLATSWSKSDLTGEQTMRIVLAVFAVALVSLSAVAQTQTKSVDEECGCELQALPATLAIVNGVTVTARDVEKATGESVRNLRRDVIEARKRELDLTINTRLLAAEATKRGLTTGKLLELEVVAKVKPPTATEIQAFYDQNRARIHEDFNAVKDDIIGYLTAERQRVEA